MFNDVGIIVLTEQNRELETPLSIHYPGLTKGKYRIYKNWFFFDDIPITKDEHHWIFTEFNIE